METVLHTHYDEENLVSYFSSDVLSRGDSTTAIFQASKLVESGIPNGG